MKKETNIFKSLKTELNEITENNDFCGSIKAYFSTYNTVNLRPDRMVKGCFDKEFQRWRNGDKLPRFFSQHWDGTIGVIDNVDDDEYGAFFQGRYINTTKGRDAYVEAKTKATDEFSFSFYVTDFDYDKAGVRNVLAVEGIDEISQVSWGMDPNTKQIEVNNKEFTIRDAEKALKNSGFSSEHAKTIVSSGFKALNRDDSGQDRDDFNRIEAILVLNNLNNTLKERLK